jgi:hypothetical protein
MSTLELQVADRFPPGTKVGVFPRIHDFFTPGMTVAVKEATVGSDGALKVSGLVEHGPYFVAAEVDGQWRAVAFTASDPSPAHSAEAANDQARREADAAAEVTSQTAVDTAAIPGGAPQPAPVHQVIEGARDTSHIQPSRVEGVPKGTQLESHTVTGQAVVVGDPVEEKPKAKKK